MNKIASVAVFALASYWVAGSAIADAREVALSVVAAELGYTYAYLGAEDAVQLSRPGVTVLIRPGQRLYDVNDRNEVMDGQVPRFARNDVYVSDDFVGRLRQIATRYASALPRGFVGVPGPAVFSPPGGSGAITSVDVRQVAGTYNLVVGGKAPANAPITVTLVETFTTEIPDVVLSRSSVTADPAGRFYAVVSAAPGYFRGGIITATASSVPGVSSASSTIVLEPPNKSLTNIPADQVQKAAR